MVVMELINGGGLNDYVKTNKVCDEYGRDESITDYIEVSMEEKGSYAIDIANGLAYIHSLNCIHRYPIFLPFSHSITSNSEILHAEIVSLISRKSKPKYRISV